MKVWNAKGRRLVGLLLAMGLLAVSLPTYAADPAFVGVISLAVEDGAAEKLGLSDEVKEKLLALVDAREAAALSLALEIKDLPPAERAERLAPFVKESERLGLTLLTLEQREKLQQLRIAKSGLETLAEQPVATALGLSDQQQAAIKELLADRDKALADGDGGRREFIRADFERRMMAVLERQQRANWERMAGLASGPVQVAQAEPPADPNAPTDPEAPTKPADPNAPTDPEAPAKPVDPNAPVDPEAPAKPADPNAPVDPEAPAKPADPNAPTDPEAPEKSTSDAPAAPEDTAPQPLKDPSQVRVKFAFRYIPWKDVLEWLAEQSDLSLLMDVPPPGTFNYTDPKSYTLAEAMDLINSVLLTKDFTLVRRERLLMVLNLEDGIPEELVEYVSLEELDKRGDFELLKCLFQLAKMEPSEVQEEISAILGPGRSMIVMPRSKQILVTETAGNLRLIRDLIERVENPAEQQAAVDEITLKYVTADDLLQVARPLLGLGEEETVNEDIQIAIDALGTRLFVTGEEDKVKRLKDLVPLIDRESGVTPGGAALELPQLETYPIESADPNQVLAVLQTLLAGLPDTRLAIDPVSGKLIALARPSDHKTIVVTLRQLEGQADAVEVLQLRTLDPQLVVLTINKLFPADDGTEGGSSLKVDGDPTTGKLWIRGTRAQIDQIKDLVEKLEGASMLTGEDRGNVRLLPYTGSTARSALDSLETLWPAIRPNRIRVVTPSNAVRAMQGINSDRFPGRVPGGAAPQFDQKPLPGESEAQPEAAPPAQPPRDRATHRQVPGGIRYIFTAHQEPEESASQQQTESTAESPLGETPLPAEPASPSDVRPPAAAPNKPGDAAPPTGQLQPGQLQPGQLQPQAGQPSTGRPAAGQEIIVTLTPQGIVIASEDVDALDEFESLLRTLTGGGTTTAPVEPTVFWLKYSKASDARQLLDEILGGGGGGGGGAGGSLLGDMASSMLGGVGGGLLGGLLGGGGGDSGSGTLQATGTVSIVADNRLNALIVQANPVDLDLVEQLLRVIDQESSPEDVQTAGKPRIIPVRYVSAEEVANVVKQVYASRLATAGSQGGNRQQPDPAEFIRALRGGGGGRQGNRQSGGEEQKMTISTDLRTNSIIVTAPEPLFEEVRSLVALIDLEDAANSEDVQVVTIPGANPQAVKSALEAVLGLSPSAKSASGTTSAQSGSSNPQAAPGGGNATADQLQQRADFFRRLRDSGAFGGGGGGPPGGGGGRPSFGAPGGGGGGRPSFGAPGGGGGGRRGR